MQGDLYPCRKFVAGLFFLFLTSAAQAADGLEDLRAQVSGPHPAEAWILAQRLEPQQAGQAEFDLLYARAALAAGHPSQAIFALERVRLQQPQQDEAQLLLAQAYLAAGDSVRAQSELDGLLASASPEAMRQQALALMAKLRPAQSRSATFGFIGFDLGYDSNINSAPDASIIGGIVGGQINVILAPGDRAQADSFARLSGGYGGRLALSPVTSVFADAYGYFEALYDHTEFNTALYQTRVGASWQTGKNSFSLPLSHQGFNVDHGRYSVTDAIALEWAYAVTKAQRMLLSVNRGQATYIDQPDRDARFTILRLGWEGIAGRARWGVNARYGMDDARVDFNEVFLIFNGFMSRRYYALGFDSVYPLQRQQSARLGILFQSSRYQEDDPFFVTRRQDQYAFLYGGWDWQLRSQWLLRAELDYAVNRSNIGLYEFDKAQMSLGVRHDFH